MNNETTTLEALFQEVHQWQVETFPAATARSRVIHLQEEVGELLQDPSNESEIADCLMLVAMVQGIDIHACVTKKFEVNKLRRWGTPDADGVVKHVQDETTTLDRTKQYTAAGYMWRWHRLHLQWRGEHPVEALDSQWINEDTFLLLNPQLVTEEGA